MRVRLGVGLGLLVIVAAAYPLGAQAAGAVLALPASARAAGAGDAAPLATGTDALFYGGAQLPRVRAAAASVGSWIGGAQFATMAVSMPVRRVIIALGLQSLDYGSVDEIVPDPLAGGTRGTATGNRVGANELTATAGTSAQFGSWRSGFTVGYLRQQIAEVSASSIVVGLGSTVAWRGWELGGSALGGVTPLAYGARRFTPGEIVRGGVLTPRWPALHGALHGVAEYRASGREGNRVLMGAEADWGAGSGWQLTLRGAVVSQSSGTARDPWSAGGSAARGDWSLDYAYQGYGALGAVHRMGVTWRSHVPQTPSR